MTIVEITGGMLRAARSLTGLTQQELADRASISRPCLTAWEGSSDSVPNAGVHALRRVVTALEAEGIEFRPNGVSLNKHTAPFGTVIHSEAMARPARSSNSNSGSTTLQRLRRMTRILLQLG